MTNRRKKDFYESSEPEITRTKKTIFFPVKKDPDFGRWHVKSETAMGESELEGVFQECRERKTAITLSKSYLEVLIKRSKKKLNCRRSALRKIYANQ